MHRTLTELWLGIRLAATGGSDSQLRAALTALGVALGVALLLFGASVPTMLSAHNARLQARIPQSGPHPARIPAPGEMLVSPALDRLLRSSRGAELGRRLHARVVGTIANPGLTGPAELF